MKEAYPTLSLRERDRRWGLIREMMKSRKLDCLIVPGLRGEAAQFEGYLTNDYMEGIVIFPLEGGLVHLTWASFWVLRQMENLRRGGTPWVEDLRVGITGETLVAILREKGFDSANIGVVNLERGGPGQLEGYIPYTTWAYVLEHLPNATFADVSQPITELAMVKSEEELAVVRRSADIGEMACEAMLKVTRPGVSESEIYATIMKIIHSNGAGANAPVLILQTGVDNTCWGPPKWIYEAQPPRLVEKGDLVQAELFPRYGGVETQQQMSVALKPVHPVNQECAETARRAYEAGLKALRPGKRFKEVGEAMDKVVKEAGCWWLTPHIHSLSPYGWSSSMGVGIEQLPGIEKYKGIKTSLKMGGDLVLKPGMLFEFEPNACRGRYRVNIGGAVLVTEDGCEELNRLPTEMQIVD